MSDLSPALSLTDVARLAQALREQIGKAVVGQRAVVDHLLVALFARGHVLLEGLPARPRPFWRRASPPRWGSISGASSSRPI
jgi:MoxR-like ATPase